MALKYTEYFNRSNLPFATSEDLHALNELVYVGDFLSLQRQMHLCIDTTVQSVNAQKKELGFKLKQKVETTLSEIGIPASRLRVKLQLCDEGSPPADYIRRKDKVKFKGKRIGRSISFDNDAAYRDNGPNWALQTSDTTEDGEIKTCATYMPRGGEIFFANQDKAYRIFLPRSGLPIVNDLTIPALRDKFRAEVGSWHTKERSPVKAIFTSLVRHTIGGSLLETGLNEVPFAWVGSGTRGYSFIGNLSTDTGNIGTHIAQLSGAKIFRIPILTDDYGRDAVFAMHPDIANHVLDKFYEAIEKSEGDVQIGEPSYVSPGLIVPKTDLILT